MTRNHKSIPDRRAALVGESYRSRGHDEVFTVAEKTAGTSGRWVCMTCGIPMQNNLEKDLHCSARASKLGHMVAVLGPPATHVLAWLSFDSQRLEVP